MSVCTKPGKHPSDTIWCQKNFITSDIFVVFFVYLPSNRSTSLALKVPYYQTRGLGVFRIGLHCLHMKQNSTNFNGSIFFVPPADVGQSCTGLLEQSVSDSCRAV